MNRFLDRFSVSKKIAEDSFWSMCAFSILGVTTILINILITKFYDMEALGIFNQSYAVFIFASQFAVFGIHLSTLKYIAQFSDSNEEIGIILFTALIWVTITASAVCAGLFFLIPYISSWLDSVPLKTSLFTIIPGLFFFSWNKVLISYLNGKRMMKAFSMFQSLRAMLYGFTIISFIFIGITKELLSGMFSVSEGLLFVIMVFYVKINSPKVIFSKISKWLKLHLHFGVRAVIGNSLLDINSRVDVLMAGFFCSDHMVGIYSFAAMLADGFNQIPIVFRTNINPVITKYFSQGKIEELQNSLQKGKLLFYKMLIPAGLITIACYPLLEFVFDLSQKVERGWVLYSILAAGMMISSGYLPFLTIFNQLGQPGTQSILLGLLCGTNILLNFIFIPVWGVTGAALATSLSWVSVIFYIKFLLYQSHKIKIQI